MLFLLPHYYPPPLKEIQGESGQSIRKHRVQQEWNYLVAR